MSFWTAIAIAVPLAVLATLATGSRLDDPARWRDRAALMARRLTGLHRRPSRRIESPLGPWWRRAVALTRPGPGWAARVRYGLSPAEYAERLESGMPTGHPEWITGELTGGAEELLAELEAATWEDS